MMGQVIVPIIFVVAIGFIGFVMVMLFSPKFTSKFMSRQIKAHKQMIEQSKDDLKSISDNMAYATKGGVKTTARAIKEGFTEDTIYCKYCGHTIDEDSKFCKMCGKEQ